MRFNAKDLNPQRLIARARHEANLIYPYPTRRKGRTLEQIIETCCYGQAAELYLIDEQGYEDNLDPYQDVIDKNGNRVEVKVTEGDYYVPYVIERATQARKTPYRKHPDILYVFIGNKKTLDYHIHNIYEWNGHLFVSQNLNS